MGTRLYVFIFIIAGMFAIPSYAYDGGHKHSEASYQHAWSSVNNGVEEVVNKDCSRVDCVTPTHCCEFDFANKWAESVGQVLHYQRMTGKRGKVILIIENPKKEMVYFYRVKELAKKYDFDVEYITPKILNPDENGECRYPNCRCHKRNKKVQ